MAENKKSDDNRKENEIYSLIPAFSFRVSLEDGVSAEDIPFEEVSGIRAEIQYEEVVDGGVNNTSYKLPKPIKYPNLVLKRGSMPQTDEFVEWCENAIYYFIFKPCTVKVELVNGDQTIKGWKFKNAYPVKFESTDLGAQKNEIIIETVELAYSSMEVIPSNKAQQKDSIASKIVSDIKNAIETIQNDVESGWKEIEEKIDEMKNEFDDAKNEFDDAKKEFDEIKDKIENEVDEITEKVKEEQDRISEKVPDLKKKQNKNSKTSNSQQSKKLKKSKKS